MTPTMRSQRCGGGEIAEEADRVSPAVEEAERIFLFIDAEFSLSFASLPIGSIFGSSRPSSRFGSWRPIDDVLFQRRNIAGGVLGRVVSSVGASSL